MTNVKGPARMSAAGIPVVLTIRYLSVPEQLLQPASVRVELALSSR